MYRLLIVDDEGIEREALRMIVRRHVPEVTVLEEAANGREAIEKAERLRPDIITMDIKMPGIDGLEAVREIRTILPDAQVIVVSAYDTFDYARQALSLGVREYVLKPSKPEEMVAALRRALDAVAHKRRQRRQLLELKERYYRVLPLVETELVASVIFDQVQEITMEELSELLGVRIDAGYAVVLRLWGEEAERLDAAAKWNVYTAVKGQAKRLLRCLVGPMIGWHLPLFVLLDADRRQKGLSGKAHAAVFVRRLLDRLAAQEVTRAVRVFAGVGRAYASLEGLRTSYHEALLASRDVLAKPAAVRMYEDLEADASVRIPPLEKEKALLEAVRRRDAEASRALLTSIFDEVEASSGGDAEAIRRYAIELFAVLTRATESEGPSVSPFECFEGAATVADIRETAHALLMQRVNRVAGVDAALARGRDLIHQAKAFIDTHFHDDLHLETVANRVHLSPYYFSKLFKERVGLTFIDYLTQVRIERAKQLLLTSARSVKEICFEVGYHDPNYFSRVFKKATGLTPTEFRQRFGGRT